MTAKEAIKMLRTVKRTVVLGNRKFADAIDVAISALGKDTNDTISRQAAIDLAMQYCPDDDGTCGKADEDIRNLLDELENLPSEHPERTCVNCGRTVNNGGWYADGGTRCPIEEHYALPKDGYCHLWEKRNVADDDYPERREE